MAEQISTVLPLAYQEAILSPSFAEQLDNPYIQVAIGSLYKVQEAVRNGADVEAEQIQIAETVAETQPNLLDEARAAMARRREAAGSLAGRLVAEFDPDQYQADLQQKITDYEDWAGRNYGDVSRDFQAKADTARAELEQFNKTKSGHRTFPEAGVSSTLDEFLMDPNATIDQIAEALRRDPKTIERELARRGVSRSGFGSLFRRKTPVPGENEYWDALLQDTRIPSSELARLAGVDKRTIKRQRAEIDASAPPGRTRIMQPGKDATVDAYVDNHNISAEKVAKALGVSATAVRNERQRRAAEQGAAEASDSGQASSEQSIAELNAALDTGDMSRGQYEVEMKQHGFAINPAHERDVKNYLNTLFDRDPKKSKMSEEEYNRLWDEAEGKG